MSKVFQIPRLLNFRRKKATVAKFARRLWVHRVLMVKLEEAEKQVVLLWSSDPESGSLDCMNRTRKLLFPGDG